MGRIKTFREYQMEAKNVVDNLKTEIKSKPIKILKKGESKEFKKIDKRK